VLFLTCRELVSVRKEAKTRDIQLTILTTASNFAFQIGQQAKGTILSNQHSCYSACLKSEHSDHKNEVGRQ
jgi:hypothetical protein